MWGESEDARPVEREAFLAAPREDVWRSLTTEGELSVWLGEDVRFDARPGGVIRVLSGSVVRRGVVEAVAAPEYLAFRWRPIVTGPNGPLPGPGTRVEFFLEARARGTRLRIVETLMSASRARVHGIETLAGTPDTVTSGRGEP